jgi:hypothetical protein
MSTVVHGQTRERSAMRFERPGTLARAWRLTSAGVGLVVCAAATGIVVLIDGTAPPTFTLIGILVALGAYWWMVTAEARRSSLTVRAVVVAVILVFGASLVTKPHESGDVWSYEIYGRMVAVHHVSPYRHFPDEFPDDPMFQFVDPIWQHTGSVYGPAFVAFSAAVAKAAGDSELSVRFLYQLTAALAMAGALVLVWRRTRSPAALAWLGLHPVVALHLVNAGRNDALIGLGILGAILLVEREKLRASGVVTGVTTAMKATAGLTGAGLALWMWRRHGLRRAIVLAVATLATVLVAYALAGGTVALGPLDHAATQVSWSTVWSKIPRLGLPDVPATITSLVTAAIVAVCLWRQTRDTPVQAGITGPAAFLLAAPFVLPGYLGWVLPGAALEHRRPTSRIIALQATLLVGAYAVFVHPPGNVFGDGLVAVTDWIAPLLGAALLVAFVVQPRRRAVRSDATVTAWGCSERESPAVLAATSVRRTASRPSPRTSPT